MRHVRISHAGAVFGLGPVEIRMRAATTPGHTELSSLGGHGAAVATAMKTNDVEGELRWAIDARARPVGAADYSGGRLSKAASSSV